MENLKQGIRNMAKEIPSTTTEISAVAEAAGLSKKNTENVLKGTIEPRGTLPFKVELK